MLGESLVGSPETNMCVSGNLDVLRRFLGFFLLFFKDHTVLRNVRRKADPGVH